VVVATALVGALLGVTAEVVEGVSGTTPSADATTVDGGLGYTPLPSPCRAIDTRSPSVAAGDLAVGEIRDVRIRGVGDFTSQGGSATGCGVPDGARSVELSITAVAPVGAGFIRVFAAASPVPNATFINYTNGRGITNTGTVPLNTSLLNDLGVANFGGATHLVVDVQGYFSAPGGADYQSSNVPCRVVDTRVGGGPLAPGGSRAFQIDGSGAGFAAQGGTPGGCGIADGAVAYEVSVTVVSPAGTGFLRVAPNDGSNPTSVFVNYTDGTGITNTGTVQPAAASPPNAPDVVVRNFGGQVHVVVDVQGVFVSGSVDGRASRYQVLTPCRTVDTRNAGGRFGAGGSRSYQTAGTQAGFVAQGTANSAGCGVPQRAAAVEVSITAAAPTGVGFTRPGPSGAAPSGTFLNFTGVGGITNTGTVPLPLGGLEDLSIVNFGGATDYLVDVLGYYEPLGLTPRSTELVAAGGGHTCSLTGDGRVHCWGRNALGQLGDGTRTGRLTPVLVAGIRDAVQVSVFGSSSCAVLSDATARCWGANDAGQLGDGTSVDRSSPVAVGGGSPLAGVVQISVGRAHACALLMAGTVRCWGDNSSGQLGVAGPVPVLTVLEVSGLNGVVRIDAGSDHTCAQLGVGTVRCWGANASGQLGDGTTTTRSTPVDVVGLNRVTRVVAGVDHTCVVLATGGVSCWGANGQGQLGDGTVTPRVTPVPTSGLGEVTQLAAGSGFTCAAQSSGAVRCWGRNTGGLLGTGTTANRLTSAAVVGVTDTTSLSAGTGHICVVSRQGRASCWGGNSDAQLGDGSLSDRVTPAPVTGEVGVVEVSTGIGHSCALVASGNVFCWGRNDSGQLGNDSLASSSSPVEVAGLTGVVQIAAGGDFTCALRFTGTVSCWGANGVGQVGDGTVLLRATATRVVGLGGVASISAGVGHTCALLLDGTLRCWGANATGALGDASTTNRTTPVPVPGLGVVTQVSAGGEHTCAVITDTTVECWGSNGDGQLGDGSTSTRSTPAPAIDAPLIFPFDLVGVRQVSAGGFHTCVTMTDNSARCWGRNDFGQLGDASVLQRTTQVAVSSLTKPAAVTAGGGHSCAVLPDGSARCWGLNLFGQLGNFSTRNESSPVGVDDTRFGLPQPLSGVVQVDAGDGHTCSATADGSALCWGRNNFGQLGDGSDSNRTTPVAVIGLVP